MYNMFKKILQCKIKRIVYIQDYNTGIKELVY